MFTRASSIHKISNVPVLIPFASSQHSKGHYRMQSLPGSVLIVIRSSKQYTQIYYRG